MMWIRDVVIVVVVPALGVEDLVRVAKPSVRSRLIALSGPYGATASPDVDGSTCPSPLACGMAVALTPVPRADPPVSGG
jgi:hypothetical protein